jgi:hypothetical protein
LLLKRFVSPDISSWRSTADPSLVLGFAYERLGMTRVEWFGLAAERLGMTRLYSMDVAYVRFVLRKDIPRH